MINLATYTMPLRAIIEKYTQDEQGLTWQERIEKGRLELFNFDYPIFDENYKKIFETNLIRKFYMREIGFETEGRFKFELESWLNLHMPYFNKLFESELIEYDPLINATMVVAHDKTNKKEQLDSRDLKQTSNTSGNVDSSSSQNTQSQTESVDDDFNREVGSNEPDSRLQLQTKQGKGVIEYAGSIVENKTDNKTNASGSSDSISSSNDKTNVDSIADQKDNLNRSIDDVEHFIERRSGKIGIDSQSKLIQDYRNALLRVEVKIHKELQQLFMLVY